MHKRKFRHEEKEREIEKGMKRRRKRNGEGVEKTGEKRNRKKVQNKLKVI
jgi:hypothetical protein